MARWRASPSRPNGPPARSNSGKPRKPRPTTRSRTRRNSSRLLSLGRLDAEVSDDVAAVRGVGQTGEGHLVAGQEGARIGQPVVDVRVVPGEARALHGFRIVE